MARTKKSYIGSHNPAWKGHQDICGSWLCGLKTYASKRNISISVTVEELWDKFESQHQKCALSGWPISLKRLPIKQWSQHITASLDRIDSTANYTSDNIQWTHKHINVSKWDIDQMWFVDTCHLISSRSKRSLPDISIEVWERDARFKGIGNLSRTSWNRIKQRSEKGSGTNYITSRKKLQGVSFEVTMEEGWQLYKDQGGRCALSGIPIYFGCPGYGYKNHKCLYGENTASLDRIDSTKGYVIDNIQWLHKDVNRMKLWFAPCYFLSLCRSVATNCLRTNNLGELLNKQMDYVR